MLGAWSVRCVSWGDWVDCRCFLSFVLLGDARRLELSPCNTVIAVEDVNVNVNVNNLHVHVNGCEWI